MGFSDGDAHGRVAGPSSLEVTGPSRQHFGALGKRAEVSCSAVIGEDFTWEIDTSVD